ncbi:MAG: hypothetical protein EAZ76_05005 [Nostocales cyanobacterium]|nr:MAG: hypothetical protein EAZ87_10250 [Nostocales cyanobacterium]TAF18403.1 MAG: hypothetical protein EAZ76_05005 [Nostocales cyanobacterium]
MKNQLSFLLKLLILSAIISYLIKYVCPMLEIPETSTNAIILVILPTLIMTIIFLARMNLQKQN